VEAGGAGVALSATGAAESARETASGELGISSSGDMSCGYWIAISVM
jgi:hypothetical protein